MIKKTDKEQALEEYELFFGDPFNAEAIRVASLRIPPADMKNVLRHLEEEHKMVNDFNKELSYIKTHKFPDDFHRMIEDHIKKHMVPDVEIDQEFYATFSIGYEIKRKSEEDDER